MVIASGTRVVLAYVEEVTHGVTPASPTLKTLRATSRNINLEKDILESPEVRSTRMKSDVRHGFNRVVGSPGVLLGMTDQDDMMRIALGAPSWSAGTTTTGINLSATASAFVRASGSWLTTNNYRPGDIVITTGFTNSGNNGTFRVLTVTATDLTVDAILIVETTGAGKTCNVIGFRADAGQTLTTLTVERQFQDLVQYQPFRGVTVNQWQLNVTPDAIINGTYTLLGMSAGAFAGTSVSGSVPTAPTTKSPFAAFTGALYEGGTTLAIATAIDFTLNNNRTTVPVLFSKFSPDVFEGTADIRGNVTLMFQSVTMYNKFVNETESSLYFRLDDPNGTDFINIIFPRIKYNAATIDPPQEGPIIIQMPFMALESATYATAMTVQRSL